MAGGSKASSSRKNASTTGKDARNVSQAKNVAQAQRRSLHLDPPVSRPRKGNNMSRILELSVRDHFILIRVFGSRNKLLKNVGMSCSVIVTSGREKVHVMCSKLTLLSTVNQLLQL